MTADYKLRYSHIVTQTEFIGIRTEVSKRPIVRLSQTKISNSCCYSRNAISVVEQMSMIASITGRTGSHVIIEKLFYDDMILTLH